MGFWFALGGVALVGFGFDEQIASVLSLSANEIRHLAVGASAGLFAGFLLGGSRT